MMATLMALPFNVSAADIAGENTTTGSESRNANSFEGTRTINFTVVNNGSITNDISLDLNTGGNTISGNTTVEDISTGDVEVELYVNNVINEVDAAIPPSSVSSLLDDVVLRSENSNTGADSENTNSTTVENDYNVSIENTGAISNELSLFLDTGNNTIENNTEVGNVSTGDIKVTGKLNNRINATPEPVQPPSDEDGGQGGGVIPATVIPQPTFSDVPTFALATSQAPTQIVLAGALTTPRDEFFPAGASLELIKLLGLLALATVVVYGADVVRFMYRRHALASISPLSLSLLILPIV